MAFYLMTYAPETPYYDVTDEDFMDDLERFRNGEEVIIRWSIQAWTKVRPNDYCYFLSQRCENRGIFGRGKILTEAFKIGPDDPWYSERIKDKHFVKVLVLNLTHYNKPFVSLDECKQIRKDYDWEPMNGGRILGKDTSDKEIGIALNNRLRDLGEIK